MYKFAQKSSFLLTQSIQRRSHRLRAGAAALTGYSRAALASDSNVQAPKADMSVPERVENYSKNITLVTQHNRALVCPSIQTLTALFQWSGAVSNIASKCPDPKTRALQPARKRSDRASPREQAGEHLFQALFCGAQERWRTALDTISQAHQQSSLKVSIRDDIAGTDPGADSPYIWLHLWY